MNEVEELLQIWKFTSLMPVFREQGINVEALSALSKDDIKELIPKTGPRALFIRCWEPWAHEFNPKTVSLSDLEAINISIEKDNGNPQPEKEVLVAEIYQLKNDFDAAYPQWKHNLYIHFPLVKQKLLDLIQKKKNDAVCKEIIEIAKDGGEEEKNLAGFLSIPHLLSTSVLGPTKKKQKVENRPWKPSKIEA